MADWGQQRLEMFKQKLQALRDARQASESRGLQSMQAIGQVGDALKGGFGDLAKRFRELGKEKRGYAHDVTMEDKRQTGAEALEKLRQGGMESLEKLRQSGAETLEDKRQEGDIALEDARSANEANKYPDIIRGIYGDDVSSAFIWDKTMEFLRAGNEKQDKEYTKLSTWLEERWLTALADIPQIMSADGTMKRDLSQVDWEEYRSLWKQAILEENVNMEPEAVDEVIDAFIATKQDEAKQDQDTQDAVLSDVTKKGLTREMAESMTAEQLVEQGYASNMITAAIIKNFLIGMLPSETQPKDPLKAWEEGVDALRPRVDLEPQPEGFMPFTGNVPR